jgi:hypothetical protein
MGGRNQVGGLGRPGVAGLALITPLAAKTRQGFFRVRGSRIAEAPLPL